MLELVPTVLKEVIDVIFRHMIYIYNMYYSTAALQSCHSCSSTARIACGAMRQSKGLALARR
jgi:hypothetical protein